MDKTKNHRLLKFSILIHISNLKFKKFLAKILEYKFIKDFSKVFALLHLQVILRNRFIKEKNKRIERDLSIHDGHFRFQKFW